MIITIDTVTGKSTFNRPFRTSEDQWNEGYEVMRILNHVVMDEFAFAMIRNMARGGVLRRFFNEAPDPPDGWEYPTHDFIARGI